MSLRSKISRKILPFIGVVFAFLTLFAPLASQNVYAEPSSVDSSGITAPVSSDPTPEATNATPETTSDTTSTTITTNGGITTTTVEGGDSTTTDSESSTSCFTQLGTFGWLVCPGTGLIAKITDAIYAIIEDLLVIPNLTMDSSSPVYIIWEYARNITNIIFVILILIIIYSQITGIGFGNYDIKKMLPRIIISAVLINLSYLICAALIDASNIVGGSVRGIFTTVENNVLASSGISTTTEMNIATIVTAVAGGGAVLGFASLATGGALGLLLTLIPVVFGALVSVIIGFLTIAIRQAVVSLLVMIAPLAFVAYTLPNTETWFQKWFRTLQQMVVFYPLFSALFGASHLAGLVLIASGVQMGGAMGVLWVILGIGVQTIPLILSFKLMKMSDTILGQLSSALTNLNGKATAGLKAGLSPARQRAAARNLNKGLENLERGRFNPFSAGSWRAVTARMAAKNSEAINKEQAHTQLLLDSYVKNNNLGRRRVIGYREDGSKIYQTPTKVTEDMRREMRVREAQLSNMALTQEYENAFSQMGSYMRQNKLEDHQLKQLSDRQYGNYLELMTHQEAKRNNDKADVRAYAEAVQSAVKTGPNSSAYRQLVTRAAGADYHNGEPTRARRQLTRNRAVTTATADAYNLLGADHSATSEVYGKYLASLKTQDVVDEYEKMLAAKDIDGIVAAQNTLAFRGDYDKIGAHLSEFMDAGNVELGTYFSNTLASNLLSMKNADPMLGRLGKHINMETWAYTNTENPKRRAGKVTMKEFFTGEIEGGARDGGTYHTKINIASGLQGTSVKGIDRTFFGDLNALEAKYLHHNDGQALTTAQLKMQQDLENALMPQIVSALPTFDAGSEQIINTVSYLTGLNYDSTTGRWLNKRTGDPDDPRFGMSDKEFVMRTTRYLAALTPNDIINLKTDTFNAIQSLFTDYYGDQAQDQFRKIFSSTRDNPVVAGNADLNAGLDAKQRITASTALARLQESKRSGTLNMAKSKVFDWLRLDDEIDQYDPVSGVRTSEYARIKPAQPKSNPPKITHR